MAEDKIYGLLGICSKSGNIIAGTDICVDNILKKQIKLIIIAKDASERTKDKFKEICEKENVKYVSFGDIEKNSKSIGKRNKAIIGIKNKGLAEEVYVKIMGGDLIGKD